MAGDLFGSSGERSTIRTNSSGSNYARALQSPVSRRSRDHGVNWAICGLVIDESPEGSEVSDGHINCRAHGYRISSRLAQKQPTLDAREDAERELLRIDVGP